MGFLGIPPDDLDLSFEKNGVRVSCAHSSAGVSTSIIIREGVETVMLDAGDGALRDLIGQARRNIPGTFDDKARTEMGSFFEGIRLIALSHDHFDHSGGLLSILRFLRMVGRRSPLTIVAPEGSKIAQSFVDIHRDGDDGGGFEVDLVLVQGEGMKEVVGWSLEWIRADHHEVTIDGKVGPRVPAVSYALMRNGVRIFYTGDTAFNERIATSATGCDLAIAEGTYPEGTGKKAHMSVEEALRVVSRAKKGWIVHLTGASLAALETTAGVRRIGINTPESDK